MKIAIDGTHRLGQYRVDCECGDSWSGTTRAELGHGFCPALPIAECIAHHKMAHAEQGIELRFTERFKAWLIHYWSLASMLEASALTVGG